MNKCVAAWQQAAERLSEFMQKSRAVAAVEKPALRNSYEKAMALTQKEVDRSPLQQGQCMVASTTASFARRQVSGLNSESTL